MNPSTHKNRRRALALALPALALPLLLGACKKDEPTTATSSGNQQQSSSGQSSSGTSSPGGQSVATSPQGQTWQINQDAWYQGFKISFGEAVYDPAKSEIVVKATIENLGKDAATLYGTYTLVANDIEIGSGYADESKNIQGGGKTEYTYTFTLTSKDKLDPDKTTILVGEGAQQQAKIPLSGKGDVVSLKPVEQEVPGPLVVGQVTLTAEKVVVRYDDPANHTQAEKDTAFLIVSGKAKNASTEGGALYVDSGGAVITLPGGNTETLENYEPSSFAAGKTEPFQMSWTIPAPFGGDYGVMFKQNWGPESTEVTVEGKLVIVASAPSGTTSGTTKGTTKGN